MPCLLGWVGVNIQFIRFLLLLLLLQGQKVISLPKSEKMEHWFRKLDIWHARESHSALLCEIFFLLLFLTFFKIVVFLVVAMRCGDETVVGGSKKGTWMCLLVSTTLS